MANQSIGRSARSSISLTRAEALGASLSLLLLPACGGANALLASAVPRSPSAKGARRPALGKVSTKPTLHFPASRPDGTTPALRRAAQSEVTTEDSGSGQEFSYEGLTAIAYASQSYLELYDSSGNLMAQISWSVDGNGVMTATGVGPLQTATVTAPSISSVVAAGSVQIDSAGGSFSEPDSSLSFSDSNTQLGAQQTVSSSNSTTITPSLSSLPTLTFQLPVLHEGGGGGCGSHGCPQVITAGGVQPMFAGGDCAAALLAAMLIITVIMDVLADIIIAACLPDEPFEPVVCGAAFLLVTRMLDALENLLQELVNAYCAD